MITIYKEINLEDFDVWEGGKTTLSYTKEKGKMQARTREVFKNNYSTKGDNNE